jgi:4-amino-4-deoxy-L-arabinose transferase-like glycosyltransferase
VRHLSLLAARLLNLHSSVYWYLSAVACAVFIGSPGPVYWDSFDYATQALTGQVGGLGAGRPVFALVTQTVTTAWHWVGGSVWDLEPVLRVLVILCSAFTAPLTRRLALESGFTARAAHFSAAVVATSPAFAHTSAAVLTDGPVVPLVLLTWIWTMRALRSGRSGEAALAGLWFGLAVGVREATLFAGATCAVMCWRASQGARLRLASTFLAATAVIVILPMAWALMTQPGYVDTIGTWLDGMAHDRAMKAWTWQEAGVIVGWVLALSPVAVLVIAIAGLRHLWTPGPRNFGTPALRDLVVPAWLQWAVMATSMGVAYSPRYLLAAFSAALAILAGWVLDRRLPPALPRRSWVLLGVVCLIPLVAGRVLVRSGEAPVIAVRDALPLLLETLPADAVIVTGHACPAVTLIRTQATLEPRGGLVSPTWTTVCPGWAWPENLAAELREHRSSGRTVVVDLREVAWRGAEQHRLLLEVRAYWAQEGARAADTLIGVQ